MNIIYFFAGFLFCFFFLQFTKSILIINSFKITENKLLLMAAALLNYKYHSIEIINIVYDKAAETDEKYIKEKEEVINKIHEKYLLFGNNFINEINNFLPYKTEYNNWNEALEYIERLIKDDKIRK